MFSQQFRSVFHLFRGDSRSPKGLRPVVRTSTRLFSVEDNDPPGCTTLSLSLFSLPSLISDPIIRCRDVVEAWNYGHWHGTVDSPLGESVAVLRLKRRETSRKKMKLSLREIRNTGIGGFRVLVGDPEERSLTGSNGFE